MNDKKKSFYDKLFTEGEQIEKEHAPLVIINLKKQE